jgi:hypothetical protein
VQEERLPWIEFKERQIKTVDANGMDTYHPEDWVTIVPQGGKDKIDKAVSHWFSDLKGHVQNKRIPPDYERQARGAYDQWKKDHTMPVNGTPLEALGLSGEQLKMVKELHVPTVEDLAQCNEDVIQRMGMGGRNLKNRASLYLASKSGPAAVAARVTAQEKALEDMKVIVQQQAEVLETLRSENNGLRSALQAQGAAAGAGAPAPVHGQPRPRSIMEMAAAQERALDAELDSIAGDGGEA